MEGIRPTPSLPGPCCGLAQAFAACRPLSSSTAEALTLVAFDVTVLMPLAFEPLRRAISLSVESSCQFLASLLSFSLVLNLILKVWLLIVAVGDDDDVAVAAVSDYWQHS